MTDTMNKNWLGITTEMSAAVKEFRTGTPNVMKGFAALARAALEPKALDIKTKELICLACRNQMRPLHRIPCTVRGKARGYPRRSHGDHGNDGLYGRRPFSHVCCASS